jgi:hypothetical protein
MSIRSEFLGVESLAQMISERDRRLTDIRSELESDDKLREELKEKYANGAGAGGKHSWLINQSIELAGLKHVAGYPLEQVQFHFHEAGKAFLRIAQFADFCVGVSDAILDSPRHAKKKYGNRPGVVKVEEYVDEQTGKKLARIHSVRQPASLIFTRSLEAALISGDAKLAKSIAEIYPYNGLNDGTILRALVLGDDAGALAKSEIYEPWVDGDKDGDWPYPRRQFPIGILGNDESLLKDGVANASKAFASRWRPSRYQTSAMLKRLGSPENALIKARKFLVDMKWLLYTHGLAFSIVAAQRGMKGFCADENGWSEWLPRGLVVSAV